MPSLAGKHGLLVLVPQTEPAGQHLAISMQQTGLFAVQQPALAGQQTGLAAEQQISWLLQGRLNVPSVQIGLQLPSVWPEAGATQVWLIPQQPLNPVPAVGQQFCPATQHPSELIAQVS